MANFSHLSEKNQAQMVDITKKSDSTRSATVSNKVVVSSECRQKLTPEMIREIASSARVAGVFAAKKTAALIPMCHPILISGADVEIEFDSSLGEFQITCTSKTTGSTGVEMESFCAASIAGLTIYDMIKAVDPSAIVGPLKLLKKTGGKNGTWERVEYDT